MSFLDFAGILQNTSAVYSGNDRGDRLSTGCSLSALVPIVPLKYVEYGIYGDLIVTLVKSIFYLLKGGYKPYYNK